MKLVGFNYLQKQHLLTLAVIAMFTSTLFSITALGFLGIYKNLNAYLSEEENIIAIYDKQSSTPFTGLVPIYLAESLSSISGVLVSSPEVLAPCITKDRAIFLRGVVPNQLYRLNSLTMLNGETLQLSDMNSAIIGKRLAEELNLKCNDEILLLSALSEQSVELEIKGIYESNTVLDDEVIAPLYVGQWLRKTDYNHVTLIRTKIDSSKISSTQIYDELFQEAMSSQSSPAQETQPNPLQEILPLSKVPFNAESLGVKETQDFMKSYLDRYGMTRETLLILSAAVFIFASASIFTSSHTLIRQHKPEITLLRSVGASVKTLKLDLIVKTLPLSIGAAFAGTVIAVVALRFIQEFAQPQVLSHQVQFQPDLLAIAINIVLVALIVVIAIVRSTKSLNSD